MIKVGISLMYKEFTWSSVLCTNAKKCRFQIVEILTKRKQGQEYEDQKKIDLKYMTTIYLLY